MSSNISDPFPKKSVAPSEKVEKQVGLWIISKSHSSQFVESVWIMKKERIIPRKITSRGSLQEERIGSILIMSDQKKRFVHVNHISIQDFIKLIMTVKI